MTAMRTPVLLSVNVGLPRNVPWQGRTVYTGIWKHPVDGPAMIRRLNIDGDGQGDTSGHGGEQRAVLVYQIQAGDRAAARDQSGPRNRDRIVCLPGRGGRKSPTDRPARPVPDAADPRRRAARPGARLLAVLGP
jgi:hypothetical protein